MCAYCWISVEVREQFEGVSSLFPSCEFQELKSDHPAWRWLWFASEPSCRPKYCFNPGQSPTIDETACLLAHYWMFSLDCGAILKTRELYRWRLACWRRSIEGVEDLGRLSPPQGPNLVLSTSCLLLQAPNSVRRGASLSQYDGLTSLKAWGKLIFLSVSGI